MQATQRNKCSVAEQALKQANNNCTKLIDVIKKSKELSGAGKDFQIESTKQILTNGTININF